MQLVVDTSGIDHGILVDASPLIYLAKIEALDDVAGIASITSAVAEETARPQLGYRHPDAIAIDRAIASGRILIVEPARKESVATEMLAERVPGLGLGERQTLAVAIERRIPTVIFDRRGRRVAAALGAPSMDLLELLALVTPDAQLLERRFHRFALLVDMRVSALEELLVRIRKGRPR